jgi:catechol 2,3-dioxygenase-like lactoylglutathione lyase family enzyme
VEDIERSVKFYRDGLGLPTKYEKGDFAEFELQGVKLALYPRKLLAEDANMSPEGTGFSGITIAHNVQSREEVDQLLAQAEQAGAKIIKQPAVASWGGYSGYFADPDGHLWEIAA